MRRVFHLLYEAMHTRGSSSPTSAWCPEFMVTGKGWVEGSHMVSARERIIFACWKEVEAEKGQEVNIGLGKIVNEVGDGNFWEIGCTKWGRSWRLLHWPIKSIGGARGINEQSQVSVRRLLCSKTFHLIDEVCRRSAECTFLPLTIRFVTETTGSSTTELSSWPIAPTAQ